MTLWKPALGLALVAAMAACSPMGPATLDDGASGSPGVGRAARMPGTLSTSDMVQSVQSSL
ncbi:MAG: hypothetical protein ACT4OK_06725 [Gemmobacter sp.]